ncbi:hypothetical protein O3P69_018409 [Scylla paramamosain]|uniref:DDE Tnp4 domain-containing protein n=1 Tax=Scylla paramamosain TaxID=85552 RepID=A0AAW0T1M0_SCYPA
MEPFVTYFDQTYVTGTYRRVQRQQDDNEIPRVQLRLIPPRFPPEIWNVHEATIRDESRTNNLCEGWNNRYSRLVGHSHPTIWRAIQWIQADHAVVATQLVLESRGEPPKKRQKRVYKNLQTRMKNLCQDRRDGRKSVEEELSDIRGTASTKTCGGLEGTHIAIKTPGVNKVMYFNCKRYHSLNIQLCDANGVILSYCSRFPGATHDAFV